MSDNLIRTEITAQLKTTKKSREFNEGVKDQVCECGGELVEQTDFLLEDELGGQRDPCQKSMIRERLNHSSFLSTSAESAVTGGQVCEISRRPGVIAVMAGGLSAPKVQTVPLATK